AAELSRLRAAGVPGIGVERVGGFAGPRSCGSVPRRPDWSSPIRYIHSDAGWRDRMQSDQIEIGQVEARRCHTGRHKSERRKFFRRDVTIEGPPLVMPIGTHESHGPMSAKVHLLTPPA